MKRVVKLKKEVKKGDTPSPYNVDLLRYLQRVHINDILNHPLSESYQAEVLENFKWTDWIDPEKQIPVTHKRGDIKLKNYPYRKAPISNENKVTHDESMLDIGDIKIRMDKNK